MNSIVSGASTEWCESGTTLAIHNSFANLERSTDHNRDGANGALFGMTKLIIVTFADSIQSLSFSTGFSHRNRLNGFCFS